MSAAKIIWAGDVLEKYADEIKQPQGKCLYNGQLIVSFVGGHKKDWEVAPSVKDKLIYEAQGDCTLNVVENDKTHEVVLKQGTLTLLPAGLKYKITRDDNTIGCLTMAREDHKASNSQQKVQIPQPLDIQKYFDEHKDEINKGPYKLYGPPNNNSIVTLYGKGVHKFDGEPKSNDSLFIVMRGEPTFQCNKTGEKHSLATFHMLHVKPQPQFELTVPEGSFVLGSQIPA